VKKLAPIWFGMNEETMKKRILSVLCGVLWAMQAGAAQKPSLPAFPGAEGRGTDPPPAEEVLKALRSPDADERIAAGRALYDVANLPATAAGTLVEGLGDRYFYVRIGSAAALVRLGAPAVPHLGRALSSTNCHLRSGAAQTLGQIGAPAGPAVPELGKALSDEAPGVRGAAAQAILSIGQTDKVVKELLRALRDPVISSHAAKALGAAGKAAVPELLAVLRDADASTADAVALAIQTMGPEAAEAAPALMGLFRRDIEALRSEAAKVEAPDRRRKLVVSFMAARPSHRALAGMGAAAAPHLLELVKSRDPISLQCACDVMARMGKENGAAVPELMKAFVESTDFDVRDAAVWGLARAGSGLPEVVALLQGNLCGQNPPVMHASASGLRQMKAARALAEVVKNGTPDGRSLAKGALTELGKDAQDAVPVLKAAAKEGDADVKSAAEEILKAIE
jgi:HEAT repeat protein